MCEFKPGDELVCVSSLFGPHVVGAQYTVAAVIASGTVTDRFLFIEDAIQLHELPWVENDEEWGFAPGCFRKVQHRDLSAWLRTATKFEEPKRKKANA